MNDPRVEAVKAHALEASNYEAGWDVVVETMEDEDIYDIVKKTRTPNGAIKKIAAQVEVLEEARKESLAW